MVVPRGYPTFIRYASTPGPFPSSQRPETDVYRLPSDVGEQEVFCSRLPKNRNRRSRLRATLAPSRTSPIPRGQGIHDPLFDDSEHCADHPLSALSSPVLNRLFFNTVG